MNGKIPSVIRWTRSDYARLNWAVRQFNKNVSKLESLELEGIPNLQQYKDLKENIYSRRELNRIIKSLKRFGKESQQRLVTTEGGEVLTQWEYSELKKAMRRATTRITDEARRIIDTDRNVIGDVQFKRLLRTKESIEDLMNRSGIKFRMTKQRTETWGKIDYELYRAEIYRENYMNSLEKMSNYDNFELLKKKLESITNPISFYNYVSKSEILKDLFLFYNDKATSQTYGGFDSNQEAFDTGIFEQLGLTPKNEEFDEYFETLETQYIEEEDYEDIRKLKYTDKYIALFLNGRKKGIFMSGENLINYIIDENLSGKLSIKVIKVIKVNNEKIYC